jgi:hypothetical protein
MSDSEENQATNLTQNTTILDCLQDIRRELAEVHSEQQTLHSRIRNLELNVDINKLQFEEPNQLGPNHNPVDAAEASPKRADKEPKLDVPIDIQAEFAAIRDAVQRVKLPADLRLTDNGKKGIKSQDQQTLGVIQRGARYTETCIKLLATVTPETVTSSDLNHLLVTQTAHLKYLQDEYATLIVQGKYDNQTATFFKSLQKNTCGLSPEARDNLEIAASLSRNVYMYGQGGQRTDGNNYGRGYRGQH